MENNVFFSTLIRNKRKIMFFFSVHLWSEIKRKCFFFCSPFIRNIKKIMLLFSVHLLSEIKRNSRFFFLTPFQKCPHRDVCSARPFECCPRKTTLGTGPCLCPPTPFQAVCAVPGTQEGKTLFLFLRYFWWRKNKNNVIGGY